MKYRPCLTSCALVLCLVPCLASADEPSLVEWTQTRVQEGLLKPLADRETSRFSRALPVARERRTRVLQTTAISDKSGRAFVPFEVDVRFAGGEWHNDDIVGCAYVGKGDLYVKRGEGYRPAEFLLGKVVDVVAGVCEGGGKTS